MPDAASRSRNRKYNFGLGIYIGINPNTDETNELKHELGELSHTYVQSTRPRGATGATRWSARCAACPTATGTARRRATPRAPRTSRSPPAPTARGRRSRSTRTWTRLYTAPWSSSSTAETSGDGIYGMKHISSLFHFKRNV